MSDSFSFLPTNLDGVLPTLVRVDAERQLELLRYTWKYVKHSGRVLRRNACDRARGVKNGRMVRANVYLEEFIFGPSTCRINFRNGDPLDFRLENLLPDPKLTVAVFGHCQGFTFDHLPEHTAALRDILNHIDYYRAEAKSSRNIFSIAKTREVLEYVKVRCAGWGYEATAFRVAANMNGGAAISPQQLLRIIQGKSCKVPGYDYAALAATRTAKPGRPART